MGCGGHSQNSNLLVTRMLYIERGVFWSIDFVNKGFLFLRNQNKQLFDSGPEILG